jgi:SPP1 family predicted phage head-tail adaptor
MSILDQIRADMAWYLTQWGEPLLRRRASVTYDAAGMGTESWSASLSFTGDVQTLSAKEIEAEAGLEQHSDYKVEAEHDADVAKHDRIERDGVNYRVSGAIDHEDHKVLYVYREIDQ